MHTSQAWPIIQRSWIIGLARMHAHEAWPVRRTGPKLRVWRPHPDGVWCVCTWTGPEDRTCAYTSVLVWGGPENPNEVGLNRGWGLIESCRISWISSLTTGNPLLDDWKPPLNAWPEKMSEPCQFHLFGLKNSENKLGSAEWEVLFQLSYFMQMEWYLRIYESGYQFIANHGNLHHSEPCKTKEKHPYHISESTNCLSPMSLCEGRSHCKS